jgi:hypothetical protein
MNTYTERPTDALKVGELDIICPDCRLAISLPVFAWMRDTDGPVEAVSNVDVDPMWEHSMLTHPEVHQ